MAEIQTIGPHRLVYGDSLDYHVRRQAFDGLPSVSALVLDPPLFAVYQDFVPLEKHRVVLEIPRGIERNAGNVVMREFIEDFLRAEVRPGEVVFDPCAGFGTTVKACHVVGAVCVAIDFNRVHYDEMVKRVREFIG